MRCGCLVNAEAKLLLVTQNRRENQSEKTRPVLFLQTLPREALQDRYVLTKHDAKLHQLDRLFLFAKHQVYSFARSAISLGLMLVRFHFSHEIRLNSRLLQKAERVCPAKILASAAGRQQDWHQICFTLLFVSGSSQSDLLSDSCQLQNKFADCSSSVLGRANSARIDFEKRRISQV